MTARVAPLRRSHPVRPGGERLTLEGNTCVGP